MKIYLLQSIGQYESILWNSIAFYDKEKAEELKNKLNILADELNDLDDDDPKCSLLINKIQELDPTYRMFDWGEFNYENENNRIKGIINYE